VDIELSMIVVQHPVMDKVVSDTASHGILECGWSVII